MQPRPDPREGVLETLLALDGEAVEIEAHLARIAASVEVLFERPLPAEARPLLLARADGVARGRLRLTVAPGDGALRCAVSLTPVAEDARFPGWEDGAELRSLPFPGGLGAHKWADRSPLPDAEGTTPLLLDGDQVLEAAWANVFCVRGGVLTTPPADGRILPGVTRAVAIAAARRAGLEVRERALGRRELLEAEEAFLTASVRGVVPVRSLDGVPIGPGELGAAIADRLRARWEGGRDAAPDRALAGGTSPGRRAP